MAQIFPRWTNKTPRVILITAVTAFAAIVAFFWYFGSPKYTDAGYRPVQPVPYSHKLHAGDLELDCRYCHWAVEISESANVPSTQICMNCHSLILTESEKLMPLRESIGNNVPVQWIRVHMLPDYVYFDHGAHLNAGVGCVTCHGNVAEMEIVSQISPLSMSWCLECHRNPAPNLRPVDQITNMNWQPPEDQKSFAEQVLKEKNIYPPVACSGCHR
ncbi:cytochrome c3 family protein [candidate division KSB1 bacterium]|nr:cytochrome c3 family protein [candidate division KSB1 bacterium]